jgi:hypothetical protein
MVCPLCFLFLVHAQIPGHELEEDDLDGISAFALANAGLKLCFFYHV